MSITQLQPRERCDPFCKAAAHRSHPKDPQRCAMPRDFDNERWCHYHDKLDRGLLEASDGRTSVKLFEGRRRQVRAA